MLTMVFMDGGHNVNITQRNKVQQIRASQNTTMPVSKREAPLARFNMGQSMRMKKVGCGACSGVR